MKLLTILVLLISLITSCRNPTNHKSENNDRLELVPEPDKQERIKYQILHQLDLAFEGTPNEYYPEGRSQDIKYNFFLDLEHGYCETAGNRIHLYADANRWAIVFEKSGYQNRATRAEIELDYVGNCIDYTVQKDEERNYISNSTDIVLIDGPEFERIENKEGKEMETFELIGKNVKEIKVRDKLVPFDNDYRNYKKVGIKVREDDNPNKLIGFGDFVRYLNETNPALISATDQDIRQHIPKDLPKLMTINEFHYVSAYDKSKPPSTQETYQLIAMVLSTRNTAFWKPKEKPNNHWVNWESGNL